MIDLKGVVRNMYKGVEPISMQEVKHAFNVLRNWKAAGIDKITRAIIKK